mgnify:CR=1 FL=1
MTTLTTPEAVCDFVRAHTHVVPRGRATKPLLIDVMPGATELDLSGLRGVLEYDPGEFTFTALAGTPVAEVEALLGQQGQYLPFDPPLAKRGATLGGTVAAGLSGPGRYRYGGVRDFILGVRWVDGRGQLVHGGGKVVKNAAGFDFPKLLVGSLGQLGPIVELTFKVFPRPRAYATYLIEAPTLPIALDVQRRLTAAPLDLEALDLAPGPRGVQVQVRLGGLAESLPARLERLRGLMGEGLIRHGAEDTALWESVREFVWVPAEATLVKVPLTPARIAALEAALEQTSAVRRYSAGGQVAWLSWPHAVDVLDHTLERLGLSGLAILGPSAPGMPGGLIGVRRSRHAFASRVKAALDPALRFPEV